MKPLIQFTENISNIEFQTIYNIFPRLSFHGRFAEDVGLQLMQNISVERKQEFLLKQRKVIHNGRFQKSIHHSWKFQPCA